MRNFLDYRVQNVPENSSKTSLLGCVSKQAKRSDDGNFLNFEFLEGQFCKKSLPLSTRRKLSIL